MSEKKLAIYFCGSMRGVNANHQNYQTIVQELSKYGEVLTTHVAYPEMSNQLEHKMNDKEIYERDYSWFTQSQVMVAEVTAPSHGVGMELGWASLRQNFKTLCLSQKEKEFKTSGLIAGCPTFEYKEYQNQQEIVAIIAEFMKQFN
ncbi:hypothetical protein ABPG74_017054 [Tetrahymena malaccensis]